MRLCTFVTESEDEARLGAASFRNLHIQEQAKEQSIIHRDFLVRMKTTLSPRYRTFICMLLRIISGS
jgi:hypothetical protein